MVHSHHPSGIIFNRSMPPGTIIPEPDYDDLEAAIGWLCSVIGFREHLCIGNHRAQLVLGDSAVIAFARNRMPGSGSSTGSPAPTRTNDQNHSLTVRVADLEANFEKVKRNGANILREPETYPCGESQYTVQDMGGHAWTFSRSVVDVAPETWGGRPVDIS